MSELDIKITTQPSEVLEAQRLRFQVFNLEMGKGLKSSYGAGVDSDEFDPYCEHLIVRDLKSKEVVGTYRLLLGSKAVIGFYSEREFALDKIKKLDGELLELGRTCARKDFRDRALIPLMWGAIAEYVNAHRVRFLFGCGSLYSNDVQEVSEIFSLLKRKYYAPDRYRVFPLPELKFHGLKDEVPIEDEQALFFKLPSLIKGYLRIGAQVCGPPALDEEFGTVDFFLLLDLSTLSSDYLRRLGVS